MKTSDIISAFILEMLEEGGGNAELQRNELAQHFKVVPSQINYVITSRFTPEQGYIIESYRGGGGFIRIKRIQFGDNSSEIMHVINSIGKSLTLFNARLFLKNMEEYGCISNENHRILRTVISDTALAPVPAELRDETRASLLKNVLVTLKG